MFGKVADQGMVAACTNPTALAGGSGELHAYLATDGRTIVGISQPKPWVVPEQSIATPWVSIPGLLTARCTSNEHATFLEVTVHGNPSDPRTDDITGDLGANGQVLANWGLHLIDVNLAMGNLLDIVGQQAKAYREADSSPSLSRKLTRLPQSLGNRRIDWSRKLVPDFHVVAIWILKEHVWLARNELAVLAHFAARCANGCQSSFDVCSAFQPEAEVSDSARLTSVPGLRSKTSTSRLPGVCA